MNEASLQTSTAPVQSSPRTQQGLTFSRRFTRGGRSPVRRGPMGAPGRVDQRHERQHDLRAEGRGSARGLVDDGDQYRGFEVPAWAMGTPERETGVRQLVSRVAETVRDWGMAGGYFATPEDAAIFHDELAHLLLTQKAAFNSPVWFNVGCDRLEPEADGQNWHWDPVTGGVQYSATGYRNPQCSACFINAVDDSLDSILTLAKTEGMLFKWGSGTGTNLSSLRGSMELLSGGGQASGPLSFMRGFDAFAGRDQERRQDAARGQDGDPERGPPGHRGLYRVQGEGRGQGLHADQGGLRRKSGRIPRRFRRSSSRTRTIRCGSATSSCGPTRPTATSPPIR